MVSVIVPCHNCANFIDRAIKSIIAQSYQDIEIILVDNNSEDNTLQLLKNYQTEYPRIISVYEQTKQGAPAARNLGLQRAKGEWIQFLDADDELLSNKINKQLQVADSNGADVIAGECLLEYKTTDNTTTITRHADYNIWQGLITSNLGITSSNLWRKQSLIDVSGWDEALTSSQEYDLLLRLLINGAKVAVDKSVNTIVHFSGNSVSKSSNKEKLKQILNNRINLRLRIKEELNSKNLLTAALAGAIDNYIYTEIMSNYHHFPAYANGLLKQHKLKVKLTKVLKLKTKVLLKSLYS